MQPPGFAIVVMGYRNFNSALAGALAFAASLLGLRLLINWTVSRLSPNLHFWSAWSQVLGPVIGTAVASIVVYVLLRNQHKQRELLGTLNHELRNALQVIAYLIPHSEAAYQEAARGAVERMRKIVKEISSRLGA